MKKLYMHLQVILFICILSPLFSVSQSCATLTASCRTYESRCAATGSIMVRASGGSGNYKYRVTGPVSTNFTTIDSITGLSAGTYVVIVSDIITNCTFSVNGVVVAGTYQDPRFNLAKVDVSCDNGSNGSISVLGLQYGRAPFTFTIVNPSPMGVSTSNSTGTFTGLIAGDYSIRLTDSCGGIQTRIVTVNNYTWRIDAYPFTRTACDEATGYIRVSDSRGNVSTVSGIPGFTYGIVRTPGDTIWSSNPNFVFSLGGNTSFQVVVKDSCGIIKRGSTSVSLSASVGANVHTYNYNCNSFSASLTNINNFFTPDYCLYDAGDMIVACNSTGVFNNIPYGSYCIRAHDACTDTTITRCFTVSAPPVSIGNQVAISDQNCYGFTATITNQVGLTNPEFCLYDSANVQVSCNNTGVFTGLTYGSYCIITRDGCIDTTITRCFSAQLPTPVLNPLVPAYITCTNFGVVVDADSVNNPLYCLYDSNGVQIICNNTGVFDSIPLGDYCVTMYDSCADVTLTECISVSGPVINNDLSVHITNERCSTFSVTATSSSLNVTEYCLYNSSGVVIVCNTTGIFDDVPYGAYCIGGRVACPDTTVMYCFRASGAVPSVNATVSTSNLTCTTFTATINRFQNLTNPDFCIYDNNNVLLSCNTRGVFDNLPYGSYCIKITDGCYDTTITRCFTKDPIPVDLSVTAGKSCSYGYAQISLNMGGSVLPVNIKVYDDNGVLFLNQNYNRNSVVIDSLPGTTGGHYYKVVATDNCGNKDSAIAGATASYFNHAATVELKCPGGLWPSGSGNIVQTVTTNMGTITVRVIKKNGVSYSPSLTPDFVSGNSFKFYDLGPGTYIIRSSENDCNKNIYDTITINNYEYPNLNRSSAYQCDVNGFSVSAVATNGVSPYRYEIIGSVPAVPSIVSGPQFSSIFNINNGNNYSLIRLRAVDACGNATLGDASILPLANNGIVVSNNCFMSPTTLSVDSILTATYAWYKKDSLTSTDSTFMGSSSSLYVPMLTEADTGIYTCYLVVNSGCIKRTYHFNLDGSCYVVLPLPTNAELKGRLNGRRHELYWDIEREEGMSKYVIERKNSAGLFESIGDMNATGNTGALARYNFTDMNPLGGNNHYRLKMIATDNRSAYSNTLVLGKEQTEEISVYPNPVKDNFTIRFKAKENQRYKIMFLNNGNQVMQQTIFSTVGNGTIDMKRPSGLPKGVYMLKIINLDNNEFFIRKIVLL